MGQRDGIERMTAVRTLKFLANMGVHGPVIHKLRNREFAHGQDQCGFEQRHFILQPARAGADTIVGLTPAGALPLQAALKTAPEFSAPIILFPYLI